INTYFKHHRAYGSRTRRLPENTGQAQSDGLSCKCNSVKETYPLFCRRCKVTVVPRIGLYTRFLIVFLCVRECRAFVLLPNRLSVLCSKRRHGLGLHLIESGFSFSFRNFTT